MPNISWDETLPSDSENAGLGDDRIRSLKSSLRIGLDSEHVWPSGGGDAGVHRLGAARVFYGPQSTVSSTGTDGRLMIASDSSRLFHVGSAGTMFLGGQTVLSVGSSPVGGQRFYWATEIGSTFGDVALGNPIVIVFPNSGFSGIPIVTVSAWSDTLAAGNMLALALENVGPTNFKVDCRFVNTGAWASRCTFNWISIGTRTL